VLPLVAPSEEIDHDFCTLWVQENRYSGSVRYLPVWDAFSILYMQIQQVQLDLRDRFTSLYLSENGG
jgi:hypothetical protein